MLCMQCIKRLSPMTIQNHHSIPLPVSAPSVPAMSLHPDDPPHVRQAMQDHFDGKTAAYAVEHRIRCKDGGYIWIASRGKVVARPPC